MCAKHSEIVKMKNNGYKKLSVAKKFVEEAPREDGVTFRTACF